MYSKMRSQQLTRTRRRNESNESFVNLVPFCGVGTEQTFGQWYNVTVKAQTQVAQETWQKMQRLLMCRICMVKNVPMHEVSNKNLQKTYENLTDIPFITEDSRPMLTCNFCYAKLEQCCQFKKQCLDAEVFFARILYSCERNPLINQGNPDFVVVKTPVENISTADDGLAEAGGIEIELPTVAAMPAASEGPYDFIEVKIEHQSDELEHDYSDKIYPDVGVVPAHRSKSDTEDDVPLLKIKTEVEHVKEEEQQELAEDERTADDTAYSRSYVKNKLKMSSDGVIRKIQDNDGGAHISDSGTSQNEIDEIATRKKLQNKIRCQRYRENIKKKSATIVSSQNKHRTNTAENEEKIKRRRERNKRNSQRYRDKKRAINLINLNPDQSSKIVGTKVSKYQNVHNLQIAGPSTRNVP